jgi:hypothetical protein
MDELSSIYNGVMKHCKREVGRGDGGINNTETGG